MSDKWANRKFKRAYFNCKKRVERGTLPSNTHCLEIANQIFIEELEKRRQKMKELIRDPVYRHLKGMLMKYRLGQKQLEESVQTVSVDRINIKTRRKKDRDGTDLW